jgi:hypothetical protein
LPASSATAKDPAAVSVDVTDEPPAAAVDSAVMVHAVCVACAIVIAEMFAQVKSTPLTADNDAQSNSSSPVSVNTTAADVAVAPARVNDTVGAVESTVTIPADATERLSAPSTPYAR